ncbi:hypothetical protein [Parasitella parasitica]|uniref:Peroxisomal biogenesis factor 11 n=1 Tax=Parasitella parasitica TaxID=35722 RepID=A0A0B7NP34_9FUNG|nr:hypothetical protein [Parasitella parasitica]
MDLPTPAHSPHHSSDCIMSLRKVPFFGNLEKQLSSPSTPLPKKIPRKRPSTFLVLQRILKDLDGRDKSMKIIQYIIKILLYHNSSHQSAHLKQLTSLATQFSITRQVLCLGNAGEDIKQLLETKTGLLKQFLLVNNIANALADDVYCLYRIGVLPQKALGHYSEIISAHCWFASIIVALHKNFDSMCRTEVYGTQEELKLAQITLFKSIADFLFCGCDVFHPSFSKGLQAWSGFASGALAGYKVYKKVQQ